MCFLSPAFLSFTYCVSHNLAHEPPWAQDLFIQHRSLGTFSHSRKKNQIQKNLNFHELSPAQHIPEPTTAASWFHPYFYLERKKCHQYIWITDKYLQVIKWSSPKYMPKTKRPLNKCLSNIYIYTHIYMPVIKLPYFLFSSTVMD